MPEFILDTSGSVRETRDNPPRFYPSPCLWTDLDAFTQGYIEALFFTEEEGLKASAASRRDDITEDAAQAACDEETERLCAGLGFADLAPEALARIIEDCVKFQRDNAHLIDGANVADNEANGDAAQGVEWERASRDFWYTRSGHGCGFWDGDWPEPYAAQLTTAAKAFGEADVYLGDDGKVHLS